MPLPQAKRVFLRDHSLREVVSQVRFPTLLEIESELPVRFQKLIQQGYPLLSAGKVLELTVDSQKAPVTRETRQFEFSSRDKRSKAVLTSEFLALTTAHYDGWEDFKPRMAALIAATIECYQPALFTRVGLRYRNMFSRDKLGLSGVPWGELLEPHVAGMLTQGVFEEAKITGCSANFGVNISERVKVQINHGLLINQGSPAEYVIDNDFYFDKEIEASADAALAALDGFHAHSNNLFHWCITDRLRDALAGAAANGERIQQ
jgi:uncharacterized protein (TIGR04255 family)